jgi:hypothetical protein
MGIASAEGIPSEGKKSLLMTFTPNEPTTQYRAKERSVIKPDKTTEPAVTGEWHTEPLRQNHLHGVGILVGEETSVIIDISYIRKDRGEKFEYLSPIYSKNIVSKRS